MLEMSLLKNKLGVCRLNIMDKIPEWAFNAEFFSVTRTSDELSIVSYEDKIPDNVKCEKGWRALKVEGPLDFSLIGILASISTILARHGISIFAISTYDTDYILVKHEKIDNAIKVLSGEDYKINMI